MKIHSSLGRLQYFVEPIVGHKVILLADQGISNLYRNLIPRYLHVRPQMYPAHVSVVRKETPAYLEPWGRHADKSIEFEYESWVYNDHKYYWLNVFCPRLEEIRRELGLPLCSGITRSPDGKHKFHMTIGNTKE